MESVGFIGIGHMGELMVSNLIKSGYTVYINDINIEKLKTLSKKGAIITETFAELTDQSNLIFLMLPNSDVVETVMLGEDGLLQHIKNDQTIIDMGSSDMLSTVKLAKLVEEKGADFVDAPVSGGIQKAEEATLTVMVGGKERCFKTIYPMIKCMGENIIHVGDVGHGHALKVLNNFLSATSLYASIEAMTVAKLIGLDIEKAIAVINKSSGQSYSTSYKFPNFILNRQFNSDFSLDLFLKDIKLAGNLAREYEMPNILGSTVEKIYEIARASSKDLEDHTEITKYIESITRDNLTLK